MTVEDYNELVFVETILRKVGFDVLSLQNDSAVSEKLLEFRPELVLASMRGRRVNGVKIGARLRRARGLPKLILFFSGSPGPTAEELKQASPDAVLSSPIQPKELIRAVAEQLQMDVAALAERYEKLGLFPLPPSDQGNPLANFKSKSEGSGSGGTDSDPLTIVKWKQQAEISPDVQDRKRDQAEKLVAELPDHHPLGIPRGAVTAQVKEFRERESDRDIQDIDRERRQFVKALFKPKS